ncbi:S8 family peptidase [Natronoglomus mannanivorans]|uniref:S8 family serine peptidase n=1 Tax=Natronoglomus mannanivorans TaxID=2979990 RepID=A0AAP3E2X6_9EURY|nr:S8 family serine peptidase [Halobacteria archaeon AArc-xg1-1]
MVRQTRRQFVTGIAAAGLTLCAAGTVSASGRQRYVVVAPGQGTSRTLEHEGFDVTAELADSSVLLVDGPAGAAADLERIDGVRTATPDVRLEVDLPPVSAGVRPGETGERAQVSEPTLYDLQWDKQVTDALAAHELATGAGTTLAILDTGIDPDHPDLARNVDEDASRLFASGDPIDADDNPWDTDGHGTHVAGIAAATGEEGTAGTGIVGMAPEATLVSAKVFWFEIPEDPDEEHEGPILVTTTGDILRAVDYAASIGADAANLSLGTAPLPPQANAGGIRTAYQRVIRHAVRRGTVVVASAGNDATTLQQGGYFSLPNSTAGAISVSATGPNDELAFYSNYGTNEIDVAAPGGGYETEAKTLCTAEGIVAGSCEAEADGDEEDGANENCTECEPGEWLYPTNLVYSTVPPEIYGEPYAYFAGTSMAAPQVTGLVGLVREVRPDANPNRVERAIEHGAEGRPGRGDPERGAGRIDARETVERL